jgi:arginyl-tRNA synthetase
VSSRHEEWDEATRTPIARAVGIGAVKFADLVNDRRNDYRFDLDRMVAAVGATGPYLQYARARIASIIDRARDAQLDVTAAPPTDVGFANDTERVLTLELAHARRVLLEVADTLEPHHLCRALLDVAGAFSSFYEQSPVVKAEPGVRELRLTLCRVTEETLSIGLSLLGIESPSEI